MREGWSVGRWGGREMHGLRKTLYEVPGFQYNGRARVEGRAPMRRGFKQGSQS